MPGRIILLRHGQTNSNVSRLLDTRPPGAELTDLGRNQATEVGRELAGFVGEREVDFKCSIALRAQQTATLAARAFEQERNLPRFSIPIDVIPNVQEIFAGDWELDASEAAHRSHDTAMRGWCYGDSQAAMEGGERLQDVLSRFQPALEEIAAQLADDRDVILVSHGAAIRVVTKHATGADADFAYTGYMPNCRFTVMEPRGKKFGEWTLTRWADIDL